MLPWKSNIFRLKYFKSFDEPRPDISPNDIMYLQALSDLYFRKKVVLWKFHGNFGSYYQF